MLRIGLTGGIGSGKSTVARLLAARGAVIVDADVIARDVVVPGGPAYAPLVERFGTDVLAADGTIDRAALAAVAFADPAALADLNALTHPYIGREMVRRLDELEVPATSEQAGGADEGVATLARSAPVAVVVVPLLRDFHVESLRLGAVVVVDCPLEIAMERLVQRRRMSERDASSRIEAQVSREERLALADYVVDNSGEPEHLAEAVDALWTWLQAREHGAPRYG